MKICVLHYKRYFVSLFSPIFWVSNVACPGILTFFRNTKNYTVHAILLGGKCPKVAKKLLFWQDFGQNLTVRVPQQASFKFWNCSKTPPNYFSTASVTHGYNFQHIFSENIAFLEFPVCVVPCNFDKMCILDVLKCVIYTEHPSKWDIFFEFWYFYNDHFCP